MMSFVCFQFLNAIWDSTDKMVKSGTPKSNIFKVYLAFFFAVFPSNA